MKKQLTVALGLAVLATPAFATKARLQALGEDSYGSQYINDNRNIWLNAAQINNHKDLVTYEFGGNTAQDSAETARGEGGVYKTFGNMVYGVHFGGASNSANAFRAAGGMVEVDATVANPTVGFTGNEENNVDVFVGGDAGLKWGANLGYARTQGSEGEGAYGESLRTRLGVIMGDLQVYGNINLINNAKGSVSADTTATPAVELEGTSKFEGKLGYQVGAIQAWQGNSVFVDYRSFDMESTINGTTPLGDVDEKEDLMVRQFEAGIGRVERLNDKTNLFAKVSYFQRNTENDHGKRGGLLAVGCELNNGFCQSFDTQRVPVVIGVETEATSWLTLRASVAQAVWGNEEVKNAGDKTESGLGETTVVNAGATLKFGELSVDGVIGNGDNTGVTGENTAAGNGTLRTDTLMTRVGMTYRF